MRLRPSPPIISSNFKFREIAAELRAAFGSVDKVEHVFVFNVGCNKLRVIAAVHSNAGKVFVRHVLSHAEYDRGVWKRREGIQ